VGKYSFLAEYLRNLKEDEITLTFHEIEGILGFPCRTQREG